MSVERFGAEAVREREEPRRAVAAHLRERVLDGQPRARGLRCCRSNRPCPRRAPPARPRNRRRRAGRRRPFERSSSVCHSPRRAAMPSAAEAERSTSTHRSRPRAEPADLRLHQRQHQQHETTARSGCQSRSRRHTKPTITSSGASIHHSGARKRIMPARLLPAACVPRPPPSPPSWPGTRPEQQREHGPEEVLLAVARDQARGLALQRIHRRRVPEIRLARVGKIRRRRRAARGRPVSPRRIPARPARAAERRRRWKCAAADQRGRAATSRSWFVSTLSRSNATFSARIAFQEAVQQHDERGQPVSVGLAQVEVDQQRAVRAAAAQEDQRAFSLPEQYFVAVLGRDGVRLFADQAVPTQPGGQRMVFRHQFAGKIVGLLLSPARRTRCRVRAAR